MKKNEDIKTLKQELFEKYGIKTDKDLIKQLGIKDEDKIKLYTWIRYQCAYSYNEGLDKGQEEVVNQVSDNVESETLEAKLRNQLTPLYGLVDMILLMDNKPEVREILIRQAKQAINSKEKVDLLLSGIEAKTLSKPNVMRKAFDAGRERISHPDWDYLYDDFDDWISKIK